MAPNDRAYEESVILGELVRDHSLSAEAALSQLSVLPSQGWNQDVFLIAVVPAIALRDGTPPLALISRMHEQARGAAYARIVMEFAKAGRVQEAIAIWQGVTSKNPEAQEYRPWSGLCYELSQIGEAAQLIEVLRQVKPEGTPEWHYDSLASGFARRGKVEDAMIVANAAPSVEQKEMAYVAVVLSATPTPSDSRIKSIIQGISTPKARPLAEVVLATLDDNPAAVLISLSALPLDLDRNLFITFAARRLALGDHASSAIQLGRAQFKEPQFYGYWVMDLVSDLLLSDAPNAIKSGAAKVIATDIRSGSAPNAR
jgi:hypothetical protein